MHLYFLTRGVNHNVELFKTFMQTQMFPWKRKNLKTGKDQMDIVQGALRPIQLWEYVFPEEEYDQVMSMMKIGKPYLGKGLAKYSLPTLRKILGAEPAPEWNEVPTHRYIFREGVGVEVIGVKKDARGIMQAGGEKYEQEML